MFYAGAIAPLVIAAVMFVAMPESLQFLVLRGRRLEKVRAWLGRIDPDRRVDADTEFSVPERGRKGMPVANLFRNGMATGTLLLWAINFMNLLCAYFLANWLPVVMNEAGHSGSQAVLAGTMLWVGGIVGNRRGELLAARGTADHVHLLISLGRDWSLADLLRDLKAGSSKWVHDNSPGDRDFAWQAGYGAFSVSASNIDAVKQYIADQLRHHATMSFQDEFRELLRKHGLTWDERYVWD